MQSERFNIVMPLAAVERDNEHRRGLDEVARLFKLGLSELGHQVVALGQLNHDCINLVLGYHLLMGQTLPPGFRCIIYQLEQLANIQKSPRMDEQAKLIYVNTLLNSECVVWDYSMENIDFLRMLGIEAIHKPLGFHPGMQRVQHQAEKDVDILFYGSRNKRREQVLERLEGQFNVAKHFGIYGEERDCLIGRSRVVINIHYYEAMLFDEVRTTYLMNNKAFTILESVANPRYEDSLVFADYDRLQETCAHYLANEKSMTEKAEQAYAALQEYPEVDYLRQALAETQF